MQKVFQCHGGQYNSCWRHQIDIFSALLAICAGNWPATGEFPAQRPVMLMFSLMCTWINAWVNNVGAGDLRRHRVHYDVTVMLMNYWYGPASPCLYYVGRCAGTKPSTVTMRIVMWNSTTINEQVGSHGINWVLWWPEIICILCLSTSFPLWLLLFKFATNAGLFGQTKPGLAMVR